LTGLANRALFRELLKNAIEHAAHTQGRFALLFLDIDNFKTINESLGHSLGDLLIIAVSRRLQGLLHDNSTMARIGGDEFNLILDYDPDQPGIDLSAQHLLDGLSRPFQIDGNPVYIGASIGVALYPTDGEDSDTLQRNAEAALHQAKQQGRGLLRFFSPEMTQRAKERLRMEPICAAPSSATNCSCTISRRSISGAANSSDSRRWYAGIIRSAVWCRPASSSRWPRRAGWWWAWANGCCARPAVRWRCGWRPGWRHGRRRSMCRRCS
jgi:diguanylate cyclase (GGDEF)-like protein